MMLEDVLGEAGYTVVGPIAELEAAMAAAATEAVDLALLDVNLMGKRVYPVAAALAERSIPFLFMTGYGDGSLPPEYVGCATVSKPYKVKTLLDALDALAATQDEAG